MEEYHKIKEPSIIALVGPSGSNKKRLSRIIAKLTNSTVVIPYKGEIDTQISDEIVSTYYAGEKYCLSKGEIEEQLRTGKNVVVLVDMCGAMTLKRSYQTLLVFCKRHREDMITDILCRDKMSIMEKRNRLLSIEQELKNERLCDMIVRTDDLCEEKQKEIIKKIFS